jgi:hypothetical protein
MVASIGSQTASRDTLTLYNVTDPTAGLSPPFVPMTADLSQSGFDTLATASRQIAIVDEIRFGTGLAGVGVVPEPSAVLLGGLGILALLRRRRAQALGDF